MDTFFSSNPGMASRIAHHIDFPDYTQAELMQIAQLMLGKLNYRFDDGATGAFGQYLTLRQQQPHFANARSVRNALDRIRLRHATRLFAADAALTREQLTTLAAEDILASRVFGNEGEIDMTIQALIFDVDGTLADTEEAHLHSFNAAFEQQGLGWRWTREQYRELLNVTGGKERIRAYIATLDAPAAERQRLRDFTPALHAEKTRLYTSIVQEGAVPLREGVAELLDEADAAGLKLAIATTTTPANVDALLTATLGANALDRFAVIAAGDAVAAKKPAPDVYELALRTLGVEAGSAIAFEDSENGLRAATGAGLWTVMTPNFWTEHFKPSTMQAMLRASLAGLTLRRLSWRGSILRHTTPRTGFASHEP